MSRRPSRARTCFCASSRFAASDLLCFCSASISAAAFFTRLEGPGGGARLLLFRKSRVALGAQFLRLLGQAVYFGGRLLDARLERAAGAARLLGRRGRRVALGAKLPNLLV